jgi:hypothetical protein
MEIAIVLAAVVVAAVLLLVLARRRHPAGDGATAAGADTSVLHCAAPRPSAARPR